MPTYTFTTSSSYALSTHEVVFTNKKIKVILSSTKQVVYEKTYGTGGVAFMCSGNNFCIGTLADNGVFTNTVDFRNNTNAALWLVEQSGENVFIGTNDETDENIYHKYDINQCPVRLKESSDVVTMECPCQNSSGTCTNDCYTYG